MRGLALSVAVFALSGAAVATAQNAPSTSPENPSPRNPPANYYPGSTAPSSSEAPADSPDRDRKAAATRARIKQCLADERASRPVLPGGELETWCRVKVNSTPPE